MKLMTGFPEAQIKDIGNGLFSITSQNIREIQIMKLERDYYREIAKNKKPFSLTVGVSSSQGMYSGVSYGF